MTRSDGVAQLLVHEVTAAIMLPAHLITKAAAPTAGAAGGPKVLLNDAPLPTASELPVDMQAWLNGKHAACAGRHSMT